MECERPVFEIKAPKIEPGALHYKTQDVKYWVRSSEFRGEQRVGEGMQLFTFMTQNQGTVKREGAFLLDICYSVNTLHKQQTMKQWAVNIISWQPILVFK